MSDQPDLQAGADQDALTPGQRYVVELAQRGRARLAGRMDVGDAVRLMIEWIDDQGNAVERLTSEQLIALGIRVQVSAAGAILHAGEELVIATNWPAALSIRDTEPRLYRLDRDGSGGTPSVRESSAAAVGGSDASRIAGYGQIAAYGDMGVETARYKGVGLSGE